MFEQDGGIWIGESCDDYFAMELTKTMCDKLSDMFRFVGKQCTGEDTE